MIVYAWQCDFSKCSYLLNEEQHKEWMELRKEQGYLQCEYSGCSGEVTPFVQFVAEPIK